MKPGTLLFLITTMLCFSMQLYALDFIVGPKAGWYVWQPYFSEMKGSGIEEIESGSGFLYGGVLGIHLTSKISLSASALTGTQATYWSNWNTEKTLGGDDISATGNFYTEIRRTDIDSALNFRVSGLFRIFAGYRYQQAETGLKGTFVQEILTGPDTGKKSVQNGDIKINMPSQGPALGIGYTQAFRRNFFLSLNVSGLYMWGKFKFEKNQWDKYEPDGTSSFAPPVITSAGSQGYDMKQMGMNVEPSLGLRVNPITITVGGRFQWTRSQFLDDPVVETTRFAPTGWMDDYLYGVFVSLLLLF